jgi:hypothetical protein
VLAQHYLSFLGSRHSVLETEETVSVGLVETINNVMASVIWGRLDRQNGPRCPILFIPRVLKSHFMITQQLTGSSTLRIIRLMTADVYLW